MNISFYIKEIRNKVARYFYNNIKTTKNNVDFKLKNVKTISIIFDNSSVDINSFVKQISNEFKKNSTIVAISMLAYNVDDNSKLEPIGFPIIYMHKKDVNWYGKPYKKAILEYLNSPSDLLINFADNKYWPIRFSAIMSNSKFKIGKLENAIQDYDFMVDVKKGVPEKDFFSIAWEYLKIINA